MPGVKKLCLLHEAAVVEAVWLVKIRSTDRLNRVGGGVGAWIGYVGGTGRAALRCCKRGELFVRWL